MTVNIEDLKTKRSDLYKEIKRRQSLINDQIWKLSKAKHAVGLLKLQYEKLDREIFESTIGITIIKEKRQKAKKSKTPDLSNIDQMSPEEVERTLKILQSRLKTSNANG